MKARKAKVRKIRRAVKNGSYDWKKAVRGTADKILEYPQSLLWK